jgi:hypothetical protein
MKVSEITKDDVAEVTKFYTCAVPFCQGDISQAIEQEALRIIHGETVSNPGPLTLRNIILIKKKMRHGTKLCAALFMAWGGRATFMTSCDVSHNQVFTAVRRWLRDTNQTDVLNHITQLTSYRPE